MPSDSSGSVFISGKNVISELNYATGDDINYIWYGFRIHFDVNSGGCLVLNENIQLRLGWQLGFRSGDYTCIDIVQCVSEGVAMIVGPRYIFLSIDEGLKNYCNEYVAAFSQSSMHENIIAKINTAYAMDNVGVYKASTDFGVLHPHDFARAYFGPGTISRLKIKLFDEYGRTISLNNMDWSMNVVFEKLYD